jgi:RNA polymerase sigma-70 factor (ECF subfamily)
MQPETEIIKSPSLIVEKYFDMVYRLARKTAGADKADDAVQNVFVRYMRHYTEFKDEEHVKAWLIKVTYNCCISELKNTWTERTTGIPDDEDRESALAVEMPETDSGGELYDAVSRLPSKYRTVIHLYYYEEYSTIEIAEITKQKESTVRSILARGRKKLEKIIKEGQKQ